MTTLGDYWDGYQGGQSEARRDWAGARAAHGGWWDDDLSFAASDRHESPGFAEGFGDELSRLAATHPEPDQ